MLPNGARRLALVVTIIILVLVLGLLQYVLVFEAGN